MGKVLKFKKPKASEKHKGKTLCKSGFHKWEIETAQTFDVKRGKLVTAYVCKRCGEKKNQSN